MTQQTDLQIIHSTTPLASSLDNARRQVAKAITPPERFKWLVIQAAIEAALNRTQSHNEPESKRGIIE